jgi:MFS transporter, PPP family, 3-phenylpropionic acid transporter
MGGWGQAATVSIGGPLWHFALSRAQRSSGHMILGSHALHDTFSVIRWTQAGSSPQTASVLWSLAVAAEVVVFFLLGPWLLDRLGPGRAIAIAAAHSISRPSFSSSHSTA